ncbi:MAG: beta-lactamase family protein [Acidobacteria bacterium]|nr:beta-lactamase family protein [Acidobacteriota bacterium]
MLRRFTFLPMIAVASFGVVAIGQQPATQPIQSGALQDQLQAKFGELHKAAAFPGGTAGFVFADGTSLAIAVGLADRAAGTPMKLTDRLLVGSVGKTYASAVALQMIHEKKFGLDDTLDKFFGTEPWFARIANASAITVRHLMTHTSGLVRYEFNPKFTRDLTANPDKV